ncbi:hypothetical protein [Mesorhizobium sp. M1406]
MYNYPEETLVAATLIGDEIKEIGQNQVSNTAEGIAAGRALQQQIGKLQQ